MVSLLSEPVTNFEGRFYTFTDARNEPKGPQQPTPPIVIGGAGPRRTMPLVAKWADHWNFPGGEADKFAEVKARLVECCEEIGRDPCRDHHLNPSHLPSRRPHRERRRSS